MSSSDLPRRLLDRLTGGTRVRAAVEVGERGARLLLARREGGAVRLECAASVDLRADGLLGPAETAARVRALFDALPGRAPAALVLPAGRTHSQLLSLGAGDRRGAAELAGAVGGRQFEAVPSVFDARPLRPFGRHVRPMWVSIAREADVEFHLLRCGLPAGRVAGVIGADAALAAAYATLPEREPLAVLIELGETSGLVVVMQDGQPVFSSDLDAGAGRFAAALAADLGCDAAAAAAIIERDGGEVLAASAAPRLAGALAELARTIDGLLADHAREAARPAAELLSAPRRVSGAGLERGRAHELFARALGGAAWPTLPVAAGGEFAIAGGVLAYGAAASALGFGPTPPDLAPAAARVARRGEVWTGRIHAAGLAAACAGAAVAAAVLHARMAEVDAREAEVAGLRAAKAAVPGLLAAREAREAAYVEALPALYFQKRTRDFVAGARSLRERRGAGDFWFALVADQETYEAGSLPQGTPAAAPETQLLAGCLARPSGLVVELGFRPGGEDPLARVDALISDLRAAGGFARVDILPARARQATLADRTVFAADGADYALRLDAAPFGAEGAPGSVATAAGDGLFNPGPSAR